MSREGIDQIPVLTKILSEVSTLPVGKIIQDPQLQNRYVHDVMDKPMLLLLQIAR
jgi:hypothetical protein